MTITIDQMADNIRRIYDGATSEELEQGLRWYQDAHNYVSALASRAGLDANIVAAALAALSPNSKWDRNKLDTAALVNAYTRNPRYMSRCKVCTYGNNKRKAIAMLRTRSTSLMSPTTGQKTFNFYQNVAHPDDVTYVTIDFHAYSIATGTRYTTKTVPSITAKRYRETSQAYRQAANIIGILPNQLQAITWCAWRNRQANNG